MTEPFHYDGQDLEAMAEAPGYVRWIVGGFEPYLGGAALEIGAGVGAISRKLRGRVERLDLVEPSARQAESLRAEFAGDADVRVFQQLLKDWLGQADAGVYDVIVMVNVLEHIRDDKAALADLKRLLKPGGNLCVYVPALPFLFSPLDTAMGHFRRYTRGRLLELAQAAGFEVPVLRYMDVLGIVPWLVVNKLFGATRMSPSAVRLYDRVGVPLTRFGESIIEPPVGKNLLTVMKNPGPQHDAPLMENGQ